MDELLGEFIAETRETLAPLAGEVVAWEADPGDRARLDTIFRFVHTVKGSCGFLDLPRLEKLSHAAEGALADVRADRRTPDAALVSAVLAIIDRIGDMVEALDAGEAYPDGGDEALIAALDESAAAPAAGPRAGTANAPSRSPVRSIRLSVELLDRMMGGVSDMVLARNELSHRLRDQHQPEPLVDAAFERLSLSIAEIRDAVTRTRMQRIENLFAPLPRMVRDLSAELGKQVSLIVEGADVELDREMIEMIRDPLTHMLRNSIDHGIEPPAQREAAGKPATGTLRISARQSGNQILIDVADDGRGIDGERLVARAVAAGVVPADQAAVLPHVRRLALVFEPGLSTATNVTSISGRGVGMDVVRANIDRIGGVIDIDSQPGLGTRFTLRVPLTLTIIPALTVVVGGQQFAIPRAAIEEIVRTGSASVRVEILAGGAEIARIRNRRVPIADVGKVLGLENHAANLTLVLLRPAGGEPYAMAVDAVCDHEELVVKPAAPAIMASGVYAGTSLPDTGRPMLLLDPAGFAKVAGIFGDAAPRIERRDGQRAAPVAQTIPTLLFRSLDGADRAVRLAVVERIEDVAAESVRFTAGRLRLALDGQVMPLFGCVDTPTVGDLRILRMSAGGMEIAYAIHEVIDIVTLPSELAPAATPGAVAGVALVEGRQVELLDVHWLFAEAAGLAGSSTERPLVVLRDAADPWTREVLRPLVEAAGYRTALAGEADESEAVVIIDNDGAAATAGGGDADVIRLRSVAQPPERDDGTIYRYDRDALVAALRSRSAKG